MEVASITRVKRILNYLYKVGMKPYRMAKMYYPYRPYKEMIKALKLLKFVEDDIVAWEKAIRNHKQKRVRP